MGTTEKTVPLPYLVEATKYVYMAINLKGLTTDCIILGNRATNKHKALIHCCPDSTRKPKIKISNQQGNK